MVLERERKRRQPQRRLGPKTRLHRKAQLSHQALKLSTLQPQGVAESTSSCIPCTFKANTSTLLLVLPLTLSAIRQAYTASLEGQLITAREELSSLHRTHAQNSQRLTVLGEQMSEREERVREGDEEVRKATEELARLRRRDDDLRNNIGAKDKAIEVSSIGEMAFAGDPLLGTDLILLLCLLHHVCCMLCRCCKTKWPP